MASYALGDFPFKKLEACPTHNSTPSPIILKTRRFSFSLKSVKFWQYLLVCLKQKCASHYSREPTIEKKKKNSNRKWWTDLALVWKRLQRVYIGIRTCHSVNRGSLKDIVNSPFKSIFNHYLQPLSAFYLSHCYFSVYRPNLNLIQN